MSVTTVTGNRATELKAKLLSGVKTKKEPKKCSGGKFIAVPVKGKPETFATYRQACEWLDTVDGHKGPFEYRNLHDTIVEVKHKLPMKQDL